VRRYEVARIIALVSIGGIVVLEGIALFKGINGVALSGSIGALGGIGGYWIRAAFTTDN